MDFSIKEFSRMEFSFMESPFPEIFFQGFFFHGNFFSWNFPFHGINFFPGIFGFMEFSFHGICFHSIFLLEFSFMEKNSWKIPATNKSTLESNLNVVTGTQVHHENERASQ